MKIGIIVHTVIINSEGKFLIIQRASDNDVYPSLWDIPGGTLETGEDPKEGAIREIKEETGLTVSDLKLFTYTSNIDKEKGIQFIRLIFKATYDSGDVKLNPREHQDYGWINISDIDDYGMVYYLPDVLKEVNESI